MRFDVKTGAATKQRTACLILPIYAGGPLPGATRSIDAAADGLITELVGSRDIVGKPGNTLMIKAPASLACNRIMLVGCGNRNELDRKTYRQAVRSAFAAGFLARAGFAEVINLAGGMATWKGAREHAPADLASHVGPASWLLENADLLSRDGALLGVLLSG